MECLCYGYHGICSISWERTECLITHAHTYTHTLTLSHTHLQTCSHTKTHTHTNIHSLSHTLSLISSTAGGVDPVGPLAYPSSSPAEEGKMQIREAQVCVNVPQMEGVCVCVSMVMLLSALCLTIKSVRLYGFGLSSSVKQACEFYNVFIIYPNTYPSVKKQANTHTLTHTFTNRHTQPIMPQSIMSQ